MLKIIQGLDKMPKIKNIELSTSPKNDKSAQWLGLQETVATDLWIAKAMQGCKRMTEDDEYRKQIAKNLS